MERGDVKRRRREGMGLGDVKMMGMVGTFLGFKQAFMTIFVASLVGTLFSIPIFGVWYARALASGDLERLRRGISYRTKKPVSRLKLAVIKTRRTAVPFGVFLGATAFLLMFVGDTVLRWYVHLVSVLPSGGSGP